jgi:hypothetical protein
MAEQQLSHHTLAPGTEKVGVCSTNTIHVDVHADARVPPRERFALPLFFQNHQQQPLYNMKNEQYFCILCSRMVSQFSKATLPFYLLFLMAIARQGEHPSRKLGSGATSASSPRPPLSVPVCSCPVIFPLPDPRHDTCKRGCNGSAARRGPRCTSIQLLGSLEGCLTCGQVLCNKCVKTGHHSACVAYPAVHCTPAGANLATISLVDPDFADGEFVVNYSCMTKPEQYVKKHVDSDDISHQYALALGRQTRRTRRARKFALSLSVCIIFHMYNILNIMLSYGLTRFIPATPLSVVVVSCIASAYQLRRALVFLLPVATQSS